MGFAAVAALGAGAGAAAGKALGGGKTSNYAVDTSIPGVTAATIKKGGKGGKGQEQVAQADIGQSLAWFQQAATEQESYYSKGLGIYQQSLQQAAQEVKAGYAKASETLQPLSWSSNQALNQQMRMLGLDPISSTINAGTHAQEAGFSDDIISQLNAANKIKDPELRTRSLESLNQQMNSAINVASPLEGQIAALGPKPITLNRSYAGDNGSGVTLEGYHTHDGAAMRSAMADPNNSIFLTTGYGPEYGATGSLTYIDFKKAAAADIAASEYNTKVQALKDQEAQRLGMVDQQKSFLSQYNNDYTPEYDAGFTGQQASDVIASTPGYQFQMDQGTEAIERQGAAAGMLGSGNTLKALTDYGQGLAQNYYGQYMSNLSNIVNEGSNATGMIATNQVNEGKDYGNLYAAYGNAALQTNKGIGDAYATSLYNQGNLYAQNAQFNASQQNMGIQNGLNRQAAKENQGTASAAGMINAQTAASQFAYGVAQNQQGGAAYTSPLSQQGYQSYTAGGVNYNSSTGKVTNV